MHFSATVLFSASVLLATGAFADSDSETSPLGLRTKPVKTSKRAIPSFLDTRQTCQGTCQKCFGPTYTDCPNSSLYCYDPTQGPASSQCSGSGGSAPGSASATPSPSATGGAGGGASDTCYQKGATCVTCFGAGSVSCPSGSYYNCYEPSQGSPDQLCNKAGSGGTGGGSGSGSSSAAAPISSGSSNACASQFGAGSVLCGQDACYNPGKGEVCCGDGTHCTAGTQCVLRGSVYKCSPGGSGGGGVGGGSVGSASATITSSGFLVTSSGILASGSSIGFIGGGASTSSTPRITRSTSSAPSSASSAATGPSSASSNTSLGAAPALLGKDTGITAVMLAGLLGLMGML